MNFGSNPFSIFQTEEETVSETCEPSTISVSESVPEQDSKKESVSASQAAEFTYFRSTNTESWADAEEDEDEKTENKRQSLSSNPSFISQGARGNEVSPKIRELDKELKTRTEITIPYKTRSFDKETGKFQDVTRKRVLRVISQQHYDQLQRLISSFKTHRGPNREYYDAQTQKPKIKLANELLNSCAKDKNELCCFVYAVANIHSRDKDGNKKVLLRNEIRKDSKCYFECENLFYRFGGNSFPRNP
jgi:hypothetical protein